MELSIIIIEYHCMNQVSDCLRSIEKNLGDVELECLIISNSEYSSDVIAKHQLSLQDVSSVSSQIINTKENLGYAGGVNTGLRAATGRYIYVVNPDCLLVDDGVTRMISLMDKNDKWAISGPVVVDDEQQVQPSCRRFPRIWTFLLVRSVFARLPGAKSEYNRYMMTDFDRKTTREVDWVSGGATLVKAKALSDIGGMDERYFLYMEDVDWCRAAWESGYTVAYCPESKVVHAGQHASIKVGMNIFANKHMRWHLSSMFKYFFKYGLSSVV